MSRYSEQWFSRFSDDWQDLTTVRGFAGGLISILSNGIVFGLLLLLARPVEGVSPEFGTSSDGVLSAMAFVVVLALSAVGGGGWFYLFQTSDRLKRRMRTFSWRAGAILVFYGGFWVLLLYDAAVGIWAAIAFVIGKGAVLLGIFIAGHR